MKKNQPIGLLDSGLGGLTVARELKEKLPNENIVFIGDELNMPYGTKTAQEIIDYCRESVEFLIKNDSKIIVFACNTATALAMPILQEEYDIPMIGVIESGAQAAVAVTKNNNVAVIATEGTIKNESYTKAISKIKNDVEVNGIAAQSFVKIVEDDLSESPLAQTMIHDVLQNVIDSKSDTLVLGCTHFPMLKPIIADILGKDIVLVDPGVETVNKIKAFLKENDMLNDGLNRTIELNTTANFENFSKLALKWLNNDIDEINLV
ncbi:glutamate racemase [Lactobacillus terrae]|uniref:glutamate racemase n=1 Tax=Lactobacillus terrae TaxID=2269374 RepID=UPI000C1B66CF|nr:glutamate racemase [Lactobacillus terrae]